MGFQVLSCILIILVVIGSSQALLTGKKDYCYREQNEQETMPRMAGASGVNTTWLGGVTEWFFAFQSKQHIIRIAGSLLGKECLDYERLADRACMTFTPSNGSVNGFGGTESKDFVVTFIEDAIQFTLPGSAGILGRFNYRLTDNESFVLGIVTWQDGFITWLALGTTPTLPEAIQTDILNYVSSIYMNPANAVAAVNGNCGPYGGFHTEPLCIPC